MVAYDVSRHGQVQFRPLRSDGLLCSSAVPTLGAIDGFEVGGDDYPDFETVQ